MDVEEVIKNFLDEVQRMIDECGEDFVEEDFRRLLGPDFDALEPTSTFGFETPSPPHPQPLAEQSRAAAAEGFLSKIAGWLKKLKPGSTKAPIGKAATAGGAVSGAAKGLGAVGLGLGAAGISKMVDQEVDIADISTSDKLGVTIERGSAPWIEKLIGETNTLIQQMIDLLSQSQPTISKGIANMDLSIDDMVAATTGEDAQSVQSRQQISRGAGRPPSIKGKK